MICGIVLLSGGCGSVRSTAHSTASVPAAGRLSASELQSRWWSWAASTDAASNPVADTDGTNCVKNQSQDVWFLAGTFGGKVTRNCRIPGSTPLAFPLVNLVGSASQCSSFMSSATGEATLDGKSLTGDHYDATQVTVTAVDGNAMGITAGIHEGHACGIWVQIPAPPSGAHQLVIKGSSGSFSVEADYELTVG